MTPAGADLPWRLAPGTMRLREGRIAGGAPFRVLRLSEHGTAELDALLGTDGKPAGALATLTQRLVRYGLLLPPTPPPVPAADVTVVVPALATADRVRAVLAAVPEGVPVVVVDDGSTPPLESGLPAVPGMRIIRHERSRGPAAARNAGARLALTTWIAFADADVLPGPDWLGLLLARAGTAVAVGPRVVSVEARGAAGLLEGWSGALDLGGTPADVGPGRPVSYVPSAVLLVRRDAFEAAGGFDEGLHVGEDVDLVWRLAGAGGRVRYEPDVVCRHRPRASFWSVVRRRFDYGASAAALERRHPGSLRHVDVSVWSFLAWLLGIVAHPAAGAAATTGSVGFAPLRLPELPPAEVRRLAGREHLLAAAALGRWLVRPMWPLTLMAALVLPGRRRVLLAAALAGTAGHVRRWVSVDRLDPVSLAAVARVAAAAAVDDAAYSLGVWAGCVRERTAAPLLPRLRGLPRLRFKSLLRGRS